MNNLIKEKLWAILGDVFDNVDIRLTDEMDVQNINGWDSLKHISFLAIVQDEFGITFDMDEIMKMNSIGEIVSAIEKKTG